MKGEGQQCDVKQDHVWKLIQGQETTNCCCSKGAGLKAASEAIDFQLLLYRSMSRIYHYGQKAGTES